MTPALSAAELDRATRPAELNSSTPSAFDEPHAAAQFYAWQRSKDTERDTSQDFVRAREQAADLPLFSSSANQIIAENGRGATPDTALDSWTPLGPGNVGGRTRTVVFHPNFAVNNTLYVGGIAGGIWRSTDAGANWTPLGDFNPNLAITILVIDRANSNHIWAGTGEGYFNVDGVRGAGIFESTDAGVTWTQLQSTQPTASNVNFRYVLDLVQSPNVANTLYATTLTGFWRSTDAGVTWTRFIDSTAGAGVASNGCHDIVARTDVGPNDTLVVSCGNFAPTGTNTGIWHSTNANVATPTFSKRLGPGGATVLNRMGRVSLAIAPSNQLTMYALIACSAQAASGVNACGDLSGTANDNHFDDALRAIYRSVDGGLNWNAQYTNSFSEATTANRELLLSNPLIGRCGLCTAICGVGATSSYGGQGWYDNVIAVDPANANRVWVGGIDLWRSDDAGVNWGVASYWGQQYMPTVPSSGYAHADQHGIWFPPNYNGVSNQTLYVSNDGGIQRTLNATAAVGTSSTNNQNTNSICGQSNRPAVAWNSLNNGYQVTQFYNGAVFPSGLTYFGGTQDNGTNLRAESSQSANQWAEINGGDGGYVAVDPTNTNILYAETTGISIEKSTNGGVTFNSATSGISDTGLFINPFLLDPNLNTRLFTSGSRLWRTANSAASWSQASSALATATCSFGSAADRYSAYAVAPGDSNLMVMGSDLGRLCRLTDATSSTGTTVPSCSTPFGTGCPSISSIAFDAFQPTSTPQNNRIVYATISDFGFDHVIKSVDGGQTWSAIDNLAGTTGRLPDVPTHTIVSDAAYPAGSRLYVGTDLGVFVTIDGGQNWMRENSGFANTPVEWLVMHNRQIGTKSSSGLQTKAPATGQLFAFTHGRSAFKTSLRAAAGFCATPAVTIPDNNVSGVSSTIVLSNISAAQSGWIDLNLQLSVAHTNIGDLSATLTRITGPGAPVSVNLFDRPGVPATSFCTGNGDNIAANFDDDADYTAETRCVDTTTPSLSGQFKPLGLMSAVMTPGTATYRLTIVDQNAGTTGTLSSWCLVPTANTDATVPVTLGYLSSPRLDDQRIAVEFETSARVGIAGFELSAERDPRGTVTRIPVDADTLVTEAFSTQVRVSGNQFYLRVLNVDGSVDIKGPFSVGSTRGSPQASRTTAAIDWTALRRQYNDQSAASIQNSRASSRSAPAVQLAVRQDGIQVLRHETLMSHGATGFDGADTQQLAISMRGQAIPIRVISSDSIFNAGDRIEFIAHSIHRPSEQADGPESIYTDTLPYLLNLDLQNALRIERARIDDSAVPALHFVPQDRTFEDNRVYAFSSPLRDPWAWSRALAFAGSASEISEAINIDDLVPSQPGEIEVTLYGGNDFPTGGNDHHAEVFLNDALIGVARFDGLTPYTINVNLAPGQLQTDNVLRVRLPADSGHGYDIVYLEEARIRYARGLNASDGALRFINQDGSGQPVAWAAGEIWRDGFEAANPFCSMDSCRRVSITGLQPSSTRIYQRSGSQWFAIDAIATSSAIEFSAPMAAGDAFEIADARGVHEPELLAVADTSTLMSGPAQYLVISHPQFASGLAGLLSTREAEGLSTKLVTVDAIYQQFTHGVIDPQAIDDYIVYAKNQLGTQYVLLVGGDSFDYLDDLGLGSIAHLPTRYIAADSIVRFAASDNAYADTDGDRVPDLALGRLPVRSLAELQHVLDRMQSFTASNAQTMIFSADQSGEGVDFDLLLDQQASLTAGTAPHVNAYMDELGVAEAKSKLIEAINTGARSITFFGHSSPDRWSYAPLLTAGDINSGAISPSSAPVLVQQMGCWNTFFSAPQRNGLVHAWMLSSSGAAAIVGSTALTEIFSNHEFGQRWAARLRPGVRIGDVLLQTKRSLADDGIAADDIQVLTTLIGDPALRY